MLFRNETYSTETCVRYPILSSSVFHQTVQSFPTDFPGIELWHKLCIL